MKHFLKIGSVDVIPMLLALQYADGWVAGDGYQTLPLRSALEPAPAWMLHPQFHLPIFDLMRRIQATRLGTVVVEKLPAGHGTCSEVSEALVMYEIVLQWKPGATFAIGEEQAPIEPGDVFTWMALDGETIERWNGSDDDQISVMIEAATK